MLGIGIGNDNSACLHNRASAAPRSAPYVDLLVDLLLVRRLRPPYHANVKKRLVKSPKVYVRDSGLVSCSPGHRRSQRARADIPSQGASWEGFVVENLLAARPARRSGRLLYRTQAGAEIDLLIELPGEPAPRRSRP